MRGETSFGRSMSTKTQQSRTMGTGASRLWFVHSCEARNRLERGNRHLPREPDAQVAKLAPANDDFPEFPGLLPNRTARVVEEKRARLVPGDFQV